MEVLFLHSQVIAEYFQMDPAVLTKSCDNSKCDFGSNFIERTYYNIDRISCILGDIYRYPRGNVSHFISSLKALLPERDGKK